MFKNVWIKFDIDYILKCFFIHLFIKRGNSNESVRFMNFNLNENILTKIGSHAFCSRTDNNRLAQFKRLEMDYDVISAMNPCLLQQLGLRNRNTSMTLYVNDVNNKLNSNGAHDYSKVCNCELIEFAKGYNISFDGVCKDFKNDECVKEDEAKTGTDSKGGDKKNDDEEEDEDENVDYYNCTKKKEFECDSIVSTTTINSLKVTTLNNPKSQTNSVYPKIRITFLVSVLFILFQLFIN